jgi:hypothetical protein
MLLQQMHFACTSIQVFALASTRLVNEAFTLF